MKLLFQVFLFKDTNLYSLSLEGCALQLYARLYKNTKTNRYKQLYRHVKVKVVCATSHLSRLVFTFWHKNWNHVLLLFIYKYIQQKYWFVVIYCFPASKPFNGLFIYGYNLYFLFSRAVQPWMRLQQQENHPKILFWL